MKKEEFIKKMQDLEHTKIKALEYNKKETEKVISQYIKECCKIKVGDVVTIEDDKAVISEVRVFESGEFWGKMNLFKKNGEPSKREINFFTKHYNRMQVITK